MSLAAVNTATPTNINHPSNQTQSAARNQHQQPSVQNAKARLTPTQVEEATQLSGNHTEVQKLDIQNELTNPLISPQQFNSKVATTRF